MKHVTLEMLQSWKNSKHPKQIWKWVGQGPFWISEIEKSKTKQKNQNLWWLLFFFFLKKKNG